MEAELTQTAIDQNLTHIETQQKELVTALDHYEKLTKEVLETGTAGPLRVQDMGPADAERDRKYVSIILFPDRNWVCSSFTLASDLNIQLDDLSKTLTQMIENINELTATSFTSPKQKSSAPNNGNGASATANGGDSAASESQDDPLMQISAVLSAHLKSLQWIDATVQEVEAKVIEGEKRVKQANLPKSLFLPGQSEFGKTEAALTAHANAGPFASILNQTREESGVPFAASSNNQQTSGTAGLGRSQQLNTGRARGFGLNSTSTFRP